MPCKLKSEKLENPQQHAWPSNVRPLISQSQENSFIVSSLIFLDEQVSIIIHLFLLSNIPFLTEEVWGFLLGSYGTFKALSIGLFRLILNVHSDCSSFLL